jgi:hypothetical protein
VIRLQPDGFVAGFPCPIPGRWIGSMTMLSTNVTMVFKDRGG